MRYRRVSHFLSYRCNRVFYIFYPVNDPLRSQRQAKGTEQPCGDDAYTHIEIILFKQRQDAQRKEHKGCKAQDTGREPAHCTAEPNQHRQNKYNREQ